MDNEPVKNNNQPTANTSTSSTIDQDETTSSLGSSLSGLSSRSSDFIMPEKWRDDTQTCIDAKVLNKESRNDITRTLVTLIVAKHGSNPGKAKCEEVSRKLILKYPFMKDDLGSGYVSTFLLYLSCDHISFINFVVADKNVLILLCILLLVTQYTMSLSNILPLGFVGG